MSEMPKNLEVIRIQLIEDYWTFDEESACQKGFDACYKAMIKTHTPNEIVKELVKENKRLKVLIAKRF